MYHISLQFAPKRHRSKREANDSPPMSEEASAKQFILNFKLCAGRHIIFHKFSCCVHAFAPLLTASPFCLVNTRWKIYSILIRKRSEFLKRSGVQVMRTDTDCVSMCSFKCKPFTEQTIHKNLEIIRIVLVILSVNANICSLHVCVNCAASAKDENRWTAFYHTRHMARPTYGTQN